MADNREIRQQELARLLLQKARQDLALVRNVGDSGAVADEIIGFHVLQAIEKGLKSVLTRLGVPYEFTHDLALLYQQIESASINVPIPLEAVEGLTAFAVQFRYILYQEEPGFDRRTGAKLAEELIEWAHSVIERPVQPQDEEDS